MKSPVISVPINSSSIEFPSYRNRHYVGSKENPLTENLVSSVLLIPLLRVFEREGLTFDEIGELTYKLF